MQTPPPGFYVIVAATLSGIGRTSTCPALSGKAKVAVSERLQANRDRSFQDTLTRY